MISTTAAIRLLIVDDHPMVRDGLKARFAVIPHIQVVGEAENAAAARIAVKQLKPNLVLMDIGMRETNGIRLTAELCNEYHDLAILILSMYDNPEYVQQAIQAGARGYLLKDAPAEEIIKAVEIVAGGKLYLSQTQFSGMVGQNHPADILTMREREVLTQLAQGMCSKEIAKNLGLSVRTVETHRLNVRRKLNIEGQAELIKFAIEHCLPPF